MASSLSVQVLLALRDRLTAPARNAGRSFTQMGRRIEEAGRRISHSSNTAAAGVARIGTAANTSAASVGRLAHQMRALRTWGYGLGGHGMMTLFGGGLVAGKMASTLFHFEAAMNTVQALSDRTLDQMKSARQTAMQLGATTKFTPTEIAQGMTELARAGIGKRGDAMLEGMIGPVVHLATAAKVSMGEAADIVTNISKTFRYQMEELPGVVDIMSQAVTSTNFNLNQLAHSMKYAGPVAKVFGVNMLETTAVLMSLAQGGLKASMAGTGISKMLEYLMDIGNKDAKKLAGIGLKKEDFFDAQGNSIGFLGILELFKKAQDEYGKLAVNDAIWQVFRQRGARTMAAALNRPIDEIKMFLDELENAKGRAKRIQDVEMQGLPGAWYRLLAATQTMVLKMGDRGGLTATLESLAKTFKALADTVASFSPRWLKLTAHTVFGVAALGALAIPLMVLGHALMFLGRMLFLPALLRGIAGGLLMTVGGLMRQSGHILRFAGALGALRFALVGLLSLSGIGAVILGVIAFWQQLKAIVGGFWHGLSTGWEGSEAQQAFRWLADKVPGLRRLFGWIKDAINSIFTAVSPENSTLTQLFNGAADAAKALLNPLSTIKDYIDSLPNIFGAGGGQRGAMAGALAGAGTAGVGRFATLPPGLSLPKGLPAPAGLAGPVTNNNQKTVNVGGISVTVNAQTNASPDAIGAAAGGRVGHAIRGALSDIANE